MVDVIIPTYKPGRELEELITQLNIQTIKPNKIILMNTERKYFDKDSYANVEIHHITKAEFSHGRTRNQGISYSEADICILMTMDAIPVDDHFIEELIKPINDEVVVSYGRQMATEQSSMVEKLTREFNYPDKDGIKSKDDVDRLQIKAFFCSNVCCAYKREIYEKLGGFVDKTIFNEDMIFAKKVIMQGYKIAYASKAKVYHSHNYTGGQQFRRNFDNGVSHAQYKDVFDGIKQESEGFRMVRTVVKELRISHHSKEIIPYIWVTGCKYLGFKLGCRYERLPKWLVLKCTSDPSYFIS